MVKKQDIKGIFNDEAQLLTEARRKAIAIHGTGDIKAAGNEVEIAVREYFKRSLPSRYHVTHGHLIDVHGFLSPQLDIIVSDNASLPSLLTTADGTTYVPATSVYAVGEIKSTYYKNKGYVEAFQKTLSIIENQMHRPLIENTKFGGLKRTSLLEHVNLSPNRKYLNNLFTFMLCVDGGDFEFKDLAPTLNKSDLGTLPTVISLLGTGSIRYGRLTETGFGISNYPREESDDFEWFFSPFRSDEEKPPAGNHLGNLYGSLIEHLEQSKLEPAPVAALLSELSTLRRSELLRASDFK